MRKLEYGVACSMDGYIAGPNGESDWIKVDPEIDFTTIWARFDTLVLGRCSYQVAVERLGAATFTGKQTFVCSRTLRPEEHPSVTIVPEVSRDWIDDLKREDGLDIWLMGGGQLFRELLAHHAVDSISIMVFPVLLGAGVPLSGAAYARRDLKLRSSRAYTTGCLSLTYDVMVP